MTPGDTGLVRVAALARALTAAMSAASARLRRHFADPLLARVGDTCASSLLAAQLRRRTTVALDGVDRVFASEAVFDPATAQRTFTVLASDYPMAVLGPRVVALLEGRAPGVTTRPEHHTTTHIGAGADSLRSVEAIVLPHGFLFELPSVDLFADTWGLPGRPANPAVGDRLTMADVAAPPWVFTDNGPAAFIAAGRQLRLLGVAPWVQMVVESLLALPFFLRSVFAEAAESPTST